MKLSELIKKLNEIIQEDGDLEVYDTQLDQVTSVETIFNDKNLPDGLYINVY